MEHIFLDNNYYRIIEIQAYFLKKVKLQYKRKTSIEFFLANERTEVEYNLIAAIVFFLSALDIYINLAYYFLEYPISDIKEFDKKDYKTKVKYMIKKFNLGDEYISEIKNFQKIRNRFIHVTEIKCKRYDDYVLIDQDFINKPHSSTLMFHPQEIEECIESMEGFLRIISRKKELRYISKLAESKISNFSKQDISKLAGYIRKDDFKIFSRTLNFISGRLDDHDNYLRKYHGTEQNSGGRINSIITNKRIKNIHSD